MVDSAGTDRSRGGVPSGPVRRRRLRVRWCQESLHRSRFSVKATAAGRATDVVNVRDRVVDLCNSWCLRRHNLRLPTRGWHNCRVHLVGDVRPADCGLVDRSLRLGDRFRTVDQGRQVVSPDRRSHVLRHRSHHDATVRSHGRWCRTDVQPFRATQPLLRRQRSRRSELLGVHAPRQLGLQPGFDQPAALPRSGRRRQCRCVRR